MSKAEKDRFLADCEADTILRSKVTTMPSDTAEERVTAIKAAGYDVTVADFKTGGPMDDTALEDVAGGSGGDFSGWPWWWPIIRPEPRPPKKG